MTDFLCIYKNHWFISWILGAIIIGIILTMFGISNDDLNTRQTVGGIHFVIHVIIVLFIGNQYCEDLATAREDGRIRRYKSAMQ